MHLEYVPLLRTQREIQGLPRDYARFRQYLRTMLGRDGVELPPLGIMNPMGKDHVTALLDAYLALDGEGIGARTAGEAAARLADVPGDFKVGLVVIDDLLGGGSNRYDCEYFFRLGPNQLGGGSTPAKPNRWIKDFWLAGVLWSSEAPTERAVREAILTAAHRQAYVQRHGLARNLREMLAQEGRVMALAGCGGPTLAWIAHRGETR